MTLKSFRKAAGLSIKGLSDKTGIGVSTLYYYEKENALLSREVAKKLAAAYKMSFRDLEALVKNEEGVTRAQFEEQAAENFKAKFKPDSTTPQAEEAPKSEPKPTPQAEAAPEPKPTPTTQTKKPPEPAPRIEETREPVIPETTPTIPEPVTPKVKMVTDAEYLEAVSGAIKVLRAILGADNNGQIMLAVGFVTAKIESKLFIDR